MTDQEHANDIRAKAKALRDSIQAALDAGLDVRVPLALQHYLYTGTAPGELEAWTIKRRTL